MEVGSRLALGECVPVNRFPVDDRLGIVGVVEVELGRPLVVLFDVGGRTVLLGVVAYEADGIVVGLLGFLDLGDKEVPTLEVELADAFTYELPGVLVNDGVEETFLARWNRSNVIVLSGGKCTVVYLCESLTGGDACPAFVRGVRTCELVEDLGIHKENL